MEIILDKNAGFCFGVKKAVDKAFELAEKETQKEIYTYGPLIHNAQVTETLKKNRITTIHDLNEFSDNENALIIIRSHGVPEQVYETFNGKNIQYIDCTCPYVSNIHKIVKQHYNEGYKIFIAGDKNHPEVIGINGWCNNEAIVLDDSILNDPIFYDEKIVDKLPIYDKICLVAQTTITKELWDKVVETLSNKYENVKIFNTICSATETRQRSAAEIACKVDLMIVVGSYDSSNTKKLYQICSKICSNTIHIETAAELPLGKLRHYNKIGITAGASTPEWIIKEVTLKMEEMTQENQNNDIVEANVVAQSGHEEDHATEALENQLNMMEEYDKSMKSLYAGDTVKGTVIMVTNDEVMVNIGYKSDGIIKKEDYTWDSELNLKEAVKPGDEIEVKVVSINDGEGNVVLSKKLIDADKNWYKIEYAYNEKTPLEGQVKEVVKGGIVVEVYGIRAFIPASHVDLRYTDDLTKFNNMKVQAYVLEYDKEKRKVVLSRKEFLKKERDIKETEFWSKIEEGQKIVGEVKRITDFGVFIDIGGVDGLLHISELSWTRVKHPSEVVKIGSKLEVVVLSIDRDKKKVSLGLKQLMAEPWSTLEGKYNVGDIVDVRVLRFSNFGAFVELLPGVDGLVHISQISDKRIVKPADVLSIGQIVKAKILEINLESKKISLSIKEAAAPVEEPVAAAPAEADAVSAEAVEETQE